MQLSSSHGSGETALIQQTEFAFSGVMEGTVRDSQIGELVSVLPGQQYFGEEKTMHLTFTEILNPSMEPLVVNLSVDASPGCGGIVWPAGQVLSNYLVRRDRSFLQDKTVLELGSGTGLVGIVAAKLGANVWVTDQAPLLDIMRQNVLRNNLISSCTIAELNWGEPIPAGIPAPDVVLAADCVYFEPAFPLLVQTLCDIYDKTPEMLFCYKKRRKADKRFFAMLKKKFTWEQVIVCCNFTALI
ncbi:putative methyltransferase-domain-containing protein [Desarmillaria ectypa]|nr:putative methyltransferase-domain-containing protein [Desarmillaria ectypa]